MTRRVYALGVAIAICVPAALGANDKPSGDLDPTFGTRGRVIVSPSDLSRATSAVVQPDSKVVLAGSTVDRVPAPGQWNARFLAIRLHRDGSLDPAFGDGGIVQTSIHLGERDWATAQGVALGPEGTLVVVGTAARTLGEGDLAVVRYTSTGALDPSFSGDGIQTLHVGPSESLSGVAVQPDGKIVAVGYAGQGFMVIRLRSNGELDESFGSGGIVDTNVRDPAYRDGALAVVVLADGKIVVVGSADGQDFAVVRYLPNGERDPRFGSDGIVVTPGPQIETAYGVAAASDGKIVLAGAERTPCYPGRTKCRSSFRLARYLPAGALDAAFGDGGVVTASFRGMGAAASSVGIASDGKVLAGGMAYPERIDPGESQFAVAAFTEHGVPDKTFGVEGRRTYDVSSSSAYEYGSAVAIQAGAARSGADRLILAGDAETVSGTDDRVAAIGVDLGPPPPRPPTRCRVPRVIGLRLGRARTRIRKAHCRVGRIRRARSTRPRGRVISQRPRAGRYLPRGGRVSLVVSRGR